MAPSPQPKPACNTGVHEDSRFHLAAILVAVLVVVASSCSPSGDSPSDVVIRHRDTSVIIRSPDCKGLLEECGGVQITFPVYVGGDEEALEAINKRIEAFFVDQLGYGEDDAGPAPSIREAAEMLMEEYETTLADFPYLNQVWIVQGTAVPLTIDSIICTEAEVFAYLGGAHPNTTVIFDLARAKDGKPVDIATLASDFDSFLRAAEAAFRHTVGMDPDDGDYASQGFWFKDNVFALPENVGVSSDSIILHYNSFEIAPYSMGTVRCTLPRSILTSPL